MSVSAHLVLPPSLHDVKNRTHLAMAYHTEANRALVKAQRHRTAADAARNLKAGDSVGVHERKADASTKHAESFFQTAKRLEAEINKDRSWYAKAKKPVINALIATAVAAEIISIPILVANCAVVGRGQKHPKTLNLG